MAEKNGVVEVGAGGNTDTSSLEGVCGSEEETTGEENWKRARCFGVFQFIRPLIMNKLAIEFQGIDIYVWAKRSEHINIDALMQHLQACWYKRLE